MITEIGYEYMCDVCDDKVINTFLPSGWTKGHFVIESGYGFGQIVICQSCREKFYKEPTQEGHSIFKKCWHKLGWGKK